MALVNPANIQAGQELSIDAQIQNTGDTPITVDVESKYVNVGLILSKRFWKIWA